MLIFATDLEESTMSTTIPSTYTVRPIEYDDCVQWCLYKHYAHRIPSISYAFGLYDRETLTLQGIITFGVPASPSLVSGAFGGQYKENFLELNRLCVNEGLPKNALSFLVSQALQMLPKPMVVVSYADSAQNHHGYIYQATNWVYTGLSAPRMDWAVKGLEGKHNRHLMDDCEEAENGSKYKALVKKYGDRVYKVERPRKHRYFYFLGDKRQRRAMAKALVYSIEKYPKGDNSRYDASFEPEIQGLLF